MRRCILRIYFVEPDESIEGCQMPEWNAITCTATYELIEVLQQFSSDATSMVFFIHHHASQHVDAMLHTVTDNTDDFFVFLCADNDIIRFSASGISARCVKSQNIIQFVCAGFADDHKDGI